MRKGHAICHRVALFLPTFAHSNFRHLVRILITDDHELVAEGLKLLLGNEPELHCVGPARNGQEALEYLEKEMFDVVLLDIDMPVMNGLDACLEMQRRFPLVKIIALTMYNQPSFIRQMMKNGASGFIPKNTSKQELAEAIQTVLNGERYLSRSASQALLDELRQPERQTTAFIPELTNREQEVLRLICKGQTTPEIAATLFVSPHTAETHRRHLLSKLGVRNTAELVRLAMERGLVD
jgi:DNA-binding NarL/FixJ family response regulator